MFDGYFQWCLLLHVYETYKEKNHSKKLHCPKEILNSSPLQKVIPNIFEALNINYISRAKVLRIIAYWGQGCEECSSSCAFTPQMNDI